MSAGLAQKTKPGLAQKKKPGLAQEEQPGRAQKEQPGLAQKDKPGLAQKEKQGLAHIVGGQGAASQRLQQGKQTWPESDQICTGQVVHDMCL